MSRWLIILLLVGSSGCLIGTWPTPEAKDGNGGAPTQPLADEACDNIDNDVDGVIDEGCRCDEEAPRECIGQTADGCSVGTQSCLDGYWTTCEALEGPFSPPVDASVELVAVTPSSIVINDPTEIVVTAHPTPPCAEMTVPSVSISLMSTTPVVRVRGDARDDGLAPDDAAADGLFSVSLHNAFGPGVSPQPLTLRAEVMLDEVWVEATTTVSLEEAP